MVSNNNTNLLNKARSFGAVYGSAKGYRNISSRLGIINKIVPIHGDKLLDIGCGNGAYTMHMASSFKSVEAIDIEPDRLKIFRQENKLDNINIYNMSADEMDFNDETFDAITAIEVVEHVNNLASVLNEVHRVLKKGGWFALTTPNRFWPLEQHGYKIGHRWFPGWTAPGLVWYPPLHNRLSNAMAFTIKQLKQYTHEAGFTNIGHSYMFPPLDSLADGHFLHRFTKKIEQTPFRFFAQTLILVAAKP
ncbi:MAG: class I SAM-dependent methyltransferase [Desulfobacula sp.]|uniref:class I SAM-dependent methyltransferase n=1 Tax=Desulfobacula sp. TaxID=2593537 RepID=UPI0025C17219|nr:class I SAM-dependent methyltransferase [Desulfobacula sp.]MCD4720406.1 class I SAM-dependent methyltransferase [Desulfobacula sp.]